MARHNNNHTSLSQFPSILSSSFIDDISLRNDHSLIINLEDNLYGLASLDDLRVDDFSIKRRTSEDTLGLELKRCTSFEEILMENHRNVLVESMREFFSRIEHRLVGKYQMKEVRRRRLQEAELQQEISKKQVEIERIIQEHYCQLSEKGEVFRKCKENADQIHVIYDVMNICPKELQFEVLYLIGHIYAECNQIIQHFRRKHLSRELKNRSITLAADLLEDKCLGKLFEECSEKRVSSAFEVLVEKWMITLFLMKVGVFENELETKSIDQYLKSDIFSQINLNDLLNQHLIRPQKKLKHD